MHSGNRDHLLLRWLVVALLCSSFLFGQAATAQDSTATTEGNPSQQVDMSAYCAAIGTPANEPSATAASPQELVPIEDGSILQGTWDMPAGSYLIPRGVAIGMSVKSGAVTVVSCDAPLRYSDEPGDEPGTYEVIELPAGVGLTIDSSFQEGVFIELPEQAGAVSLVAQGEDASQIDLEVIGTSESDGVCTAAECWDWSAAESGDGGGDGSPVPTLIAAATPGGPPIRPKSCGWYRC